MVVRLLQQRSEERIPCDDLEVVDFNVKDQPVAISAVLTDKSASGLGAYTKPITGLAVGTLLILQMAVYEVRWIKLVSEHIQQMGLRLVNEMM